MNRPIKYATIVSFLISFLSVTNIAAQGGVNLQKAEQLHRQYDFEEAKRLYEKVKADADSSEAERMDALIMQCDNGLSMLNYACSPTVVTSRTLPIKDFYLYYSQMKDLSWIPSPNPFVGEAVHPLCNATYFDKATNQIYFSAPDKEGRWNINRSVLGNDNVWSVPSTLSEALVSNGDEIFPVVSADGKRLYFSSNAMAGMGGYDIFVSYLCADGISWSAPENLGFPYSSPADDFLYFDTPDGKFSMFASNRNCGKDSITIYVLAFEHNTIRKRVSSVSEAREIAELRPRKSVTVQPEDIGPQADAQFKEWFAILDKLAQVKDSIAFLTEDIDALRSSYASADEAEKSSIAQRITEGEFMSMALQQRMRTITGQVSAVEADYLAKGITPPVKTETAKPQVQNGSELQYAFVKNSYGKLGEVTIQEPEPEFDYTFKVGQTAVIMEDNTLPAGICYQVQLCAVASKLGVKKFRGMSPVFEVKQKTGKYIYYAGVFATYEDASEALPKVKKCGFSGAYVVAFKDGKSISVKNARAQQK